MKQTAAIFQALSDETRLRVMKLLEERELCVCELMQVLEMSQPRISRHLGVLKHAGLVTDRRAGRWVFYALTGGPAEPNVHIILQSLRSLDNDNPLVAQDRENLKKAVRLSELDLPCASCDTSSL
jgi:ArsR family transcriptional regulator